MVLVTAVAAVATLLLFADTSASIVAVWWRSETFTHGFFVLPIFVWLVWRERHALAGLEVRPSGRLLLPIAAAGALWSVSSAADVLVGRQLALVAMVILVVASFIGPALTRALRFPLLFLLFLAPVGEELVPLLMRVTADLTVGAISMTDIPIYREGLFFSLPSGNWSVVEACSGVRYLIASIMLGSLYAHLSYRSALRKIAFVALSAIVPIVANGVRAFLIVMLGHFSGMKLASGVDHLVYGWLFFGLVMFALFSLGALFQEHTSVTEDKAASSRRAGASGSDTLETPAPSVRVPHRLVVHAAAVAICIAVWPLWSAAVDERAAVGLAVGDLPEPFPPALGEPVSGDDAPTAWRPTMIGQDATRGVIVETGGVRPTVLALAYAYATQRQGKEMISSSNVLVGSRDEHWRLVGRGTVDADGSLPFDIEWSRLVSSAQTLLVWRWYRVGDTYTAESWRAKLLETRDRLLLRRSPSVAYVLAADAADPDAARAALRSTVGTIVGADDVPGTRIAEAERSAVER